MTIFETPKPLIPDEPPDPDASMPPEVRALFERSRTPIWGPELALAKVVNNIAKDIKCGRRPKTFWKTHYSGGAWLLRF